MKKSLMTLLQVLVVLFGLCALVFMITEPLFEGRNVNATLFQVYFNDVFLVCAYIASVSILVVLYQVFKLFGYAGEGKM